MSGQRSSTSTNVDANEARHGSQHSRDNATACEEQPRMLHRAAAMRTPSPCDCRPHNATSSSDATLLCGWLEHDDVRGPRVPSPRGRFPRWPRPDMTTSRAAAFSLHSLRARACARAAARELSSESMRDRYHRSKFFFPSPSRDLTSPGTSSPRAF